MAVVLKKSDSTKIKADCIEWQGAEVLDIRLYVATKKTEGEFIPTAKGVQIPIDKAEEFAKRLLKMVREYNGS